MMKVTRFVKYAFGVFALTATVGAAFASIRVQAQCMATGQAAGTLAAFRPDEDVRQLDFPAVRSLCERSGAVTDAQMT